MPCKVRFARHGTGRLRPPDRNLALELVRVTEGCRPGPRAGGWAKGDKNAADGAAVDAMRIILNSVSMEGHRRHRRGARRTKAPMLFNGEEIGGPADRPATSPSTRSTARRSLRSGRNNAIFGDRDRRARHHVRTPGPVRLHGQDRRSGPRSGRRHRPRRADQGQPQGRSRRPRARTSTTSPRWSSTVPRHEDIIRECREAGATDQASSQDRRRRRRHHRRDPR